MLTFARYLIFQVPAWGIALVVAWGLDASATLPRFWIGLGLGAFVILDLLIYPFVRSAYEHRPHDAGQGLVGRTARVVVTLDPNGWVQLGSERWRAQRDAEGPAIEVGTTVCVSELRGQVLLVRNEIESES